MKNKKIIILSVIVSLFLFILFKSEHFALDTYTFSEDVNANATWYLANGRVVMYVFLKLSFILNLTCKSIKSISLMTAILSLFAANILLNARLNKHMENDIYAAILSTALIYCPFIIELFLFPEFTGTMCLAILFSVLGATSITNYFETKHIRNLFLSLIYATLCAFSYQGVMGCFASLAILFSCINYKNFKTFIIQHVYIVATYTIASLSSLIITKLMGLTRLSSGGIDIIKTIKGIMNGSIYLLINTSRIFPKYLFIILSMAIALVIFVEIIKTKSYKQIPLYVYLVLISVAFSIAPQLLVDPNSIWIVARSNICMSYFPIFISILAIGKQYSKSFYQHIIVCIISMLMIFQVCGWYTLAKDHYYTNKMDEIETMKIIEYIDAYEQTNNAKITKLAFANDKDLTKSYDKVTTTIGDINLRTYAIDWARKGIIDYYSNKNYEIVTLNNSFTDSCRNNDWTAFDNSLLMAENDTLYICIY